MVEIETQRWLKDFFRPEFLNRLDEVVVFNTLTKDDIRKIIRVQIAELSQRLQSHKIDLSFHPSAEGYLADRGYDPVFGARPLKRLIQHEIQDLLAYKILDDTLKEGDRIEVRHNKERLTFHRV